MEALETALRHVARRSAAVDGGAHAGEWTEQLAGHFAKVHAFEPADAAFRYLNCNATAWPNVVVHRAALWNRRQKLSLVSAPSRLLTSNRVEEDPHGTIPAVALDDMALPDVALLKLDLEGAEPLALRGAAETIRRCKPVLVVEINGRCERYGYTGRAVITMIRGMGYRRCGRVGGDFIYA